MCDTEPLGWEHKIPRPPAMSSFDLISSFADNQGDIASTCANYFETVISREFKDEKKEKKEKSVWISTPLIPVPLPDTVCKLLSKSDSICHNETSEKEEAGIPAAKSEDETNLTTNTSEDTIHVETIPRMSQEAIRAEKEFLYRFGLDISQDDFEFLCGTPHDVYGSLPTESVLPVPQPIQIAQFNGPDDNESEESFLFHACGRTISTYPYLGGNVIREGSPVCDSFEYRLYQKRTIVCVTDGCNWGVRPRLASRGANKTFIEYMETYQRDIRTVKEAGNLLLRATSHAHNAIKKQAKQMKMECGSTTLFGGILLELAERLSFDEFEEDKNWVFVCVNVGDCKAFITNPVTKSVEEITKGNRTSSKDASDPGGRLGANGCPDLRNLKLFCFPCKKDDIIIVCSDGVFDNLDPKPLGIVPRDLGVQFDSWEDEMLDPRALEHLFNRFRLEYMKNILFQGEPKSITPQNIVKILLHHALETTRNSRLFMQKNPSLPLPEDYSLYPGKMDHTTCVSFIVGAEFEENVQTNVDILPSTNQWLQTPEESNNEVLSKDGRTARNVAFLTEPVLLHIPLTVNSFENEDEVILVCEIPPQCDFSFLVKAKSVFVRMIPKESNSYKKLLGDAFLFGINELDQPIEREIILPCIVEPDTKLIEIDTQDGLVTLRIKKRKQSEVRFELVSI